MLSKSLFKLIFSSGSIQLVPLFMIPAYTRIYTVNDIADYGVIFALCMTLSPLITLRLEHALVKINANKLLYKFAIELFCIALITSAFLATIIINYFSLFTNYSRPTIYLLIFCALSSNAIFLIFINLLVKVSDYNAIVKCRIIKVLFEALTTILFGFYLEISFGLVLGYIIGAAVSLLYFIIIYKDKLRSYKTKIYVFKFFVKDYATKDVPSSFLNQLAFNLPIYLMSFFSINTSYIASYTMALRIISAPSTLIGNSIGVIFRGHAQKELKSQGNYLKSFNNATILSVLPAIIVFNVLILSNEAMWLFIFGNELTNIEEIAKIFAIVACLKIISMSVSYGYYISSALTANLIFQFINFLIGFSILFISGYYGNLIYNGLIYYASALSFYYLFFILYGYKLSHGKTKYIQVKS